MHLSDSPRCRAAAKEPVNVESLFDSTDVLVSVVSIPLLLTVLLVAQPAPRRRMTAKAVKVSDVFIGSISIFQTC